MKIILYHGLDPDFYKELKVAAEIFSGCEVVQSSPEEVSLVDQAFRLRPHIIFMDASFAGKLIEDVRWMKVTPLFSSILMTAICKDEMEVNESAQLVSAGVSLFHMVDTDSECFIQDCFQIAFGTRRVGGEFAQAKNLEIDFSIGFLSSLAAVGTETFFLETDLELQDEVTLKLPMSGNCRMDIKNSSDGGTTLPFTKSYEVKYPYAGPWDELSENSLQPATVETWIELRKNTFDLRTRHICCFTQDEKFLKSLAGNPSLCWYQTFGHAREATGLSLVKPGIIFFDLQDAEGPDVTQLAEVMRSVKQIEPPPMLIIFGSKSDSVAMRKVFEYEFILAVSSRLDHQMFRAFEKKFLEKSSLPEPRYFLRPDDPDRTVILEKQVILTSITERNLTFIIDGEIPYYTVAKIELPLPAYLTIIPSEGKLPASPKGQHYTAIIHGISEENLAHLRKIVNQLIYKPNTSLTREQVEHMLKQDYVVKTEAALGDPKSISVVAPVEPESDRFHLKKNYKGKSKL